MELRGVDGAQPLPPTAHTDHALAASWWPNTRAHGHTMIRVSGACLDALGGGGRKGVNACEC
eukprot:365584-Chlamydomonas_euryale.AAC.16